jgi:DNA invertase Pin-like site-specific DNA recombinase
MDLQEAQIRKFAELTGFTVKKTFYEAASAGGENNLHRRPELQAAIRLCKRKRWPLIVARVNRLTREPDDLVPLIRDNRLEIIVAELGERGDYVTMCAEAARGQLERELIGGRTKKALEALAAQGVELGNRTNLPEAQEKGLVTIKRKAGLRLDEFEQAWSDAYKKGETDTAADFTRFLNRRGHRTAQGKAWTAPNVRRMLRNALRRPIPTSAASAAPTEREPEQSMPEETDDPSKKNPLWGMFR